LGTDARWEYSSVGLCTAFTLDEETGNCISASPLCAARCSSLSFGLDEQCRK
jgi:hypothetical protein